MNNTQVIEKSSKCANRNHKAVIHTRLSGFQLLLNARLNKGTAFTEKERDAFALHGLLPPHIGTLEEQRCRRMKAFESLTTAFAKYSFMRDLQDTNETLFYSLIAQPKNALAVTHHDAADVVIARVGQDLVDPLAVRIADKQPA